MTTVLPPASSSATARSASGPSRALSAAWRGEATSTVWPITVACTALPGMARASRVGRSGTPSVFARSRMARAMGWLLPLSTAAANPRSDRSDASGARARMSVTRGRPAVSVPVLSNATVRTRPMTSSAAPPFTSSPRRAPAASPDAMAAGVESTSAQGQAIRRSARPR
ncbi:hypothetical protein CHKEEEPN_0750 [Methylorubrum podarium]|nr:hypothetical protein CHKEEEPN_0750 [Methylorubrum podarium]